MSRPPRPRALAVLLATLVGASVLHAAPATADRAARVSPERAEWLANSARPQAVAATLAKFANKLPPEFDQRLRYALPTGSLRVIVALTRRTPAIEDAVESSTSRTVWFPKAPRFLALATPDQVAQLVSKTWVSYLEPDYRLTYFLATSVVSSRARSLGPSVAVWRYGAGATKLGALASDVEGLSADAATGKGVTVAVTDSGIDKTHKDFGGFACKTTTPMTPCESRITRAVTVEAWGGVTTDPGDAAPTTDVASGHGTHVAGTVGGNGYYMREDRPNAGFGGDGVPIGVAPQASLLSVKLGDSQWAGLGSLGLQWQANNAAKYGIRVSTNSWGCATGCTYDPRSAQSQTIKDLYSKGVLVTVAAGNNGDGDGTTSSVGTGQAFSGMAQSPYAVGVAAYDHDDGRLAGFSSRGVPGAVTRDPATWFPELELGNEGRRPDLAAPGVSIWSADASTIGTSNLFPRLSPSDAVPGAPALLPYTIMSGTSMATPHVAGAAAIMFSACPQARPLDAMRALMVGAQQTPVLKTSGSGTADARETGYGDALNVRASLDWLRTLTICGGPVEPAPASAQQAPAPQPLPAPSPTAAGASPSPSPSPSASPEPSATAQPSPQPSPTASPAMSPTTGSLRGAVRDRATGAAITRALVDCGDGLSARSDSRGRYVIDELPEGTRSCSVTARRFRGQSRTLTIVAGETTRLGWRLRR